MNLASDTESYGGSDCLQSYEFSEEPPVLRKRFNDSDLNNSKRLKISDQKGSRIDIRMKVNPTDSNDQPHAMKKISPRTTEKKFGKDVTNVVATNSNHKTNADFSCSNFTEADKAFLDKLTSEVLKGFPKLTSMHKGQPKIFDGEQSKGYFNRNSRVVDGELKWTKPKEVETSTCQKENEDAKTKIRKRTEPIDNEKENIDTKTRNLPSQDDVAAKQISSIMEFNIDSNTDITLFESLSETEESSSGPDMDNVKLFDQDSTEIADTKKVEETVPVRSLRPRGSTRNMFKNPLKLEEKTPRKSYKQPKKVLKRNVIDVDDMNDKDKREMARLLELEDIYNNYELTVE